MCVEQLQVLQEGFFDENQVCDNIESKFLFNHKNNENDLPLFSL